MRKLWFLLALMLAPVPVGAQVWTNSTLSPWSYSVISSTSAVVVKSTAGVLGGVQTTGIQTNALTCYDNASAASGTILATGTLGTAGLGLAAIPMGGIQAVNGITCVVPTAITGTVIIYYH
jgi:hypothetical protein